MFVYTQHTRSVHTAYTQCSVYTQRTHSAHTLMGHSEYAVCICCVYAVCMLCVRCVYAVCTLCVPCHFLMKMSNFCLWMS